MFTSNKVTQIRFDREKTKIIIVVDNGDIEAEFLHHFDAVIGEFQKLPLESRRTIESFIKKNSEGLVHFLQLRILSSLPEYNLLCHIRRGLFSITRTELLSVNGVESNLLKNQRYLANSVALIIEKTLLIESVMDQFNDGRLLWPREIWGLYFACDDRDVFLDPGSKTLLQYCLNHMIYDAFQHLFEATQYLYQLECPKVIKLVSFEMALAISRLVSLYNKPQKIQILPNINHASLLRRVTGIKEFKAFLKDSISQVDEKISLDDPTGPQLKLLMEMLKKCTGTNSNEGGSSEVDGEYEVGMLPALLFLSLMMIVFALGIQLVI